MNSRKYVENQFEDQREIVVDHATGLMWQKSGSDNYMTYQDAEAYIKQLNTQKFAGYTDWRLPTIPELVSLLEPEKQSNGWYLNPVFNIPQKRSVLYWSADLQNSSGVKSHVYFAYGYVTWHDLWSSYYVRAVRSLTKP